MSSSAPKAPAIHSSAQFLPDNPRQQSPPTLLGSSQPSIYVFFSLPILLPSAWTTASIFNEPVTPFDLTAPSLHPLFFQPHFPPGACTQTCSLVVLPPPRRSTGGAGKRSCLPAVSSAASSFPGQPSFHGQPRGYIRSYAVPRATVTNDHTLGGLKQ
ncbi:unnamed protein product [Rangifer tarandus platyrhynchus]|uniref:Uncharacterized protein n=1 Tax=Rangifer tarandus platyrhynchus TaxID=3082113 RepID=A0AC59YYQ0_RANTA